MFSAGWDVLGHGSGRLVMVAQCSVGRYDYYCSGKYVPYDQVWW
jgi:hypothetical protein